MTDVVIIGAGAAGLMCARVAGKRGRSVLVLERAARIGNKILISGGGRCNFTNLHAGPENYLSANPDFCKSALARYTPLDFVALVERHRIRFHEKKLGQLFCDHSSRDIVEMLQRECAGAGVEIQTSTEVREVRRAAVGFEIETSRGVVQARRLVVATGGLSLPKLGATDFAYRLARQFGLKVLPVRAGLVPFTFSGEQLEFCRGLSGVSTACAVRADNEPRSRFAEQLLFTHRGLSGPAMLQISSYWQASAALSVSLFPEGDARRWLEENRRSGAQLHTLLARRMPERLAVAWVAGLADERNAHRRPEVDGYLGMASVIKPPRAAVRRTDGYLGGRAMRSYRAGELDEIARQLEGWTMRPAGTEGYATAEVTVGGGDTRELRSKTMEARTVPGLHFIGEAVDVTGWLGGYNFQWAWASGNACGLAV